MCYLFQKLKQNKTYTFILRIYVRTCKKRVQFQVMESPIAYLHWPNLFEGSWFRWAELFSEKGWGQTRPLPTTHFLPQVSGLTSSSPGQKCYLFVILPVPLEIHAAILTALDEGPPTSTGLHVTEYLEEIGEVGSWKPQEAARSQVWASPRVIWLTEPHRATGELGGPGPPKDPGPNPPPVVFICLKRWASDVLPEPSFPQL